VDVIEINSLKTVYVNLESSLEFKPSAQPITTTGSAEIKFSSDSDKNERGFLVSYQIKNPQNIQSKQLRVETTNSVVATTTATTIDDAQLPHYNFTCQFTTAEQGGFLIVKSPGYPNGYPVNADCKWEIEVTEENIMIELEMIAFHIEESNACQFDSLKISDGPDTVGLGMNLCGELGQEVPRLYQMRNGYVKLHFKSDDIHGYEGFEIKVGF
jgi:hypothetical protein